MTRIFFTYTEVLERIEIDAEFLRTLEQESIVTRDAPAEVPGEYSERMLERARVAHTLVHELDVNLAGAAIIVRMREEMSGQRRRIERFLAELSERHGH